MWFQVNRQKCVCRASVSVNRKIKFNCQKRKRRGGVVTEYIFLESDSLTVKDARQHRAIASPLLSKWGFVVLLFMYYSESTTPCTQHEEGNHQFNWRIMGRDYCALWVMMHFPFALVPDVMWWCWWHRNKLVNITRAEPKSHWHYSWAVKSVVSEHCTTDDDSRRDSTQDKVFKRKRLVFWKWYIIWEMRKLLEHQQTHYRAVHAQCSTIAADFICRNRIRLVDSIKETERKTQTRARRREEERRVKVRRPELQFELQLELSLPSLHHTSR